MTTGAARGMGIPAKCYTLWLFQSAATATLAAAEAAAADDGLSEGIIRIKLIEYHGKAGCDAMGKNAIKDAKERPSRTPS